MTKIYRDVNGVVVNVGEWDLKLTPVVDMIGVPRILDGEQVLDEDGNPVFDGIGEQKVDGEGNLVFAEENPLPDNLVVSEEDIEELSDGSRVVSSESYSAKRRIEYPSIADQLDDIYHNGIEGWRNSIQAIKNKNPKT